MRADAEQYAGTCSRERAEHLRMHTRTRLPLARLAVSTRIEAPPGDPEDAGWGELPCGEFGSTELAAVRTVEPPSVGDAPPAEAPLARRLVPEVDTVLSPTQRTEVRVAHDAGALYVHFTCAEREPHMMRPERGEEPIFRTDCVELYLDVDHDHHHYLQFAVSAGGDRQVLKMSAPLDSMRWERKVKSDPVEIEWSAQARVGVGRWYCLIRVPFAAVGIRPGETAPLGVNFARIRTIGLGEDSQWNLTFRGSHAPWAFGDLYLQAPPLHVARADLGAVRLWENRGSLLLRSLSDAPVRATLLVEVLGGKEQDDVIYRGEFPVAIEGGEAAELPFDFPFDRDEWRWTFLRLSIVHGERTVYRGGYRFGRGQVGWLLPVDYRRGGAAAPDPSAEDPEFVRKKRAYIVMKQPAFSRLTTADGAASDFVLAADDGSVRFDLMKPGVLQEMADYVYGLYDNDVDRLLGATFFIHQPAVMTYAGRATALAVAMGPLSAIRLGAGQCCVFANALLGLLEKMKCEATGRPYRGSRWAVPGHVTTVVELGGRLVHLDPSIGRFYYRWDNRTLAGPGDLLADAALCDRAGKYLSRYYANNDGKAKAHYYRPEAGVYPSGAPAE